MPATNVNPTAGPTPNGAEGRIVLAVPDATGNAAEDPDLRRLALRGRCQPRRRFLRALRHQGLRRELDRSHYSDLAAERCQRSGDPDQRRQPGQLSDHGGRPVHRPGQLRPDPDHRPDRSQRRLPGWSAPTAVRPPWFASMPQTSGTPTRSCRTPISRLTAAP